MQGKLSRAGISAGLVPDSWVCLFEKEDPTEDPVFNYRGVNVYLDADHLNQANVEYIVQSSNDHINWSNILVGADPVVPGGEIALSVMFSGRWVRVILFSHSVGRVDATVAIPEDQVVPGLWPNVHSLGCSSYCEQSIES